MLEFAIATPWDAGFLRDIAALNRTHTHTRISEIFGSHRTSITGGGRPSFRLPDVSAERFEQHVREARESGLRFNYTMNSPSLAGREEEPEWLRRLSGFLEYLAGCGVDKLTVAHPFLLKFVGREFPSFGLTVSLIAGVDSVARAREYERLGVEVINLDPFTINRDFETLRAIRGAVRCKLEVYANIACLDRCPSRHAHYLHSGQASRDSREGGSPDLDQDSFLRRCSRSFLAEPSEFLRSPFIRPEDVHVYRDLGIDIVKLADRTEPAEILARTARAYCEEKYEGNLFELIFRRGKKFRAGVAASHPEARSLEVPIVIDNQALDRIGFIERIGELRGEEREEFYRSAAEKIVEYTDPQAIDQWKRLLQ